jgi:hypothetical protein
VYRWTGGVRGVGSAPQHDRFRAYSVSQVHYLFIGPSPRSAQADRSGRRPRTQLRNPALRQIRPAPHVPGPMRCRARIARPSQVDAGRCGPAGNRRGGVIVMAWKSAASLDAVLGVGTRTGRLRSDRFPDPNTLPAQATEPHETSATPPIQVETRISPGVDSRPGVADRSLTNAFRRLDIETIQPYGHITFRPKHPRHKAGNPMKHSPRRALRRPASGER